MDEEGTRDGYPGVLRDGGAHGKSVLRRRASISGFEGDVEDTARPESGAPGVHVDRKLGVLYRGVAGFETTRRNVLIGARGVEIKEKSMASQICSHPAPITTQLSAMAEISHFGSWQPEY